MAVNWSDFSRESEARATTDALRQMPSETALQNAVLRTGSARNVTSKNANPDAGATRILRLDRVNIADGVLK
jgi:hypothetical protein